MPLFTAEQLRTGLRYEVGDDFDTAGAEHAEKVVAGWLLDATGLTEFPAPLPPQLWSWAVELGGIYYENPTSLETDASGEVSSAWGMDRRSQILESARAWSLRTYGRGQGGAPRPRGTFPAAGRWPDQGAIR